ncbi:MAG: tripartite tricarboxylate transporter substrate binding protein [Ottowia sp.]|uniref:Bug family tripartite tricarboxylate transporter substrate binding protein n=1 Tax=Ottowia sp. TaxID=1898956 RepID=UPI003C72D1BB
MQLTRRPIIAGLLACAMITMGSAAAWAAPSEGRIIVGNQPGGATDIAARMLAPEFAKATGHQWIVENRTGASGNIAAEHVAKAPADGNTILLVFNSHTTISSLFPKLPFDPVKDFASVGLIAQAPYLLVARPAIGVDNLRELIARAKKDGKPITIGSPGQGTPQHLLAEQLRKAEGVEIDTVHYKGSAPAQTDVMGGHVDITLVTPSLGGPFVKAGKLKLLGVTSDARLPEFPNTPTTRELGVATLNSSGVWLALLVPAKTPAETVARLNKTLNEALRTPEVLARLKSVGMLPMGGTSEQLDKLMRQEQATWSTLIKESKITLD